MRILRQYPCRSRVDRVHSLLLWLTVGGYLAVPGSSAADPTSNLELTWRTSEVAGIDEAHPDASFPSATVLDAAHRSLLIRFPGLREAVESYASRGLRLSHAEILVDYAGFELRPPDYAVRAFDDLFALNPPRWHLEGALMRKPWSSREGVTFNAAGPSRPWTLFGAADTSCDRFPTQIGPAEASERSPIAALAIAGALEAAHSLSPIDAGDLLDRSGVILRKQETYDHRYADTNAAELAVATGGHGLRISNPRVRLVFERASDESPSSPPGARLEPGCDGQPALQARQVDAAAIAGIRSQLLQDRSRLLDWQRHHIEQLLSVGGDNASPWENALLAGDLSQIGQLSAQRLRIPPRFWLGWYVHDDLIVRSRYSGVLPSYLQRYIDDYWRAWLMPDIATSALLHPQSEEAARYSVLTGDWRGRSSFFRDGYNFAVSTENYNHTAAMGALVGGGLIGADFAIADGRHGLEAYPLRLWSFRDGSTQEMLDHYYYSITVSGQKVMADLAPTAFDRLMARVALDRSIDLLASAYHPLVGRIVAPSGRTNMEEVLFEQDGIYSILHTLSKRGTIRHADSPFNARVNGMRVWGLNTPPGRIGVQALMSPWAGAWAANLIDDKRLPFEVVATDTVRGTFNPPLWCITFLSRRFGMASKDFNAGAVDFIAQWARHSEPEGGLAAGTMTAAYKVDDFDLATTRDGVPPRQGALATFHYKNKAIVFGKPLATSSENAAMQMGLALGVWTLDGSHPITFYIEEAQVTSFPARARHGEKILLRDGEVYAAIIPLDNTDLGRTADVEIIDAPPSGQSDTMTESLRPSFLIVANNRKGIAAPARLSVSPYAAFVIEFADADEFPAFEDFVRHVRSASVAQNWDERTGVLHVSYRSGDDLMEAGYSPNYKATGFPLGIEAGQQTTAFTYRRVNGRWPYLPAGVDRETPISIQGNGGELRKNGAVLRTEPGHVAYLIADAERRVYSAYNPIPDPTPWSLQTPEGMTLSSRGKVGLLRVDIDAAAHVIRLESATRPRDTTDPATMRIVGMDPETRIFRNGRPVSAQRLDTATGPAYEISLGDAQSLDH